MNHVIKILGIGIGLMMLPAQVIVAEKQPLTQVKPIDVNKVWAKDEQIWGTPDQPGDKWSLIRAISYSLRYLETPKAAEVYEIIENRKNTRRITSNNTKRIYLISICGS